jgi:HAD superfamily hydrolase (TIGR01509 family)
LLRALIFDFDGVLVDSEPIVLKLTQEMAAREGWSVSAEEYYCYYLALDDRGIVERLYRSHGRPVDSRRRDELVAWKAGAYGTIIREGLPPFPGAVEFVRRAAALYPLAIASGSLRAEIEHLLEKLQLREAFKFITSAEDAKRSKPDPEIYFKALALMQELPEFQSPKLRAAECLAIEDAPGGIQAARAAGLRCLALAHSRPAGELTKADWVFRGFHEVDLEKISREFL